MTTLQDVLARRADRAGTPALDLDALVGLGEQRLRRRRLAVVLGSATAVVAVVALAVGLALGGVSPRSQGPVQRPTSDHSSGPGATPVRRIVYSDAPFGGNEGFGRGHAIHYGARVVETGIGFTFTDVTDDGFVYMDHRNVMFSDGGAPTVIGSHSCGDEAGFRGYQVRTANQGSLAVWFECSRPGRADLVVYDTRLGRDVVRREVDRCGGRATWASCLLDGVVGEHVYFTRYFAPHGGPVVERALEYDVATGRVTAAGSYGNEIRRHPRGLVTGDSWATGTATNGIGQHFVVVGSRLVPSGDPFDSALPPHPTVFDTATRSAVRLRLPAGYRGAGGFKLVEWLDDDTVALMGPDGWGDEPGYGDILRCHLATGRCDLVVRGHGPVRVAPNGGLPG